MEPTKASSIKIENQAKDSLDGPMEKYTQASGLTVKNMESACGLHKTETAIWVSGKKELFKAKVSTNPKMDKDIKAASKIS